MIEASGNNSEIVCALKTDPSLFLLILIFKVRALSKSNTDFVSVFPTNLGSILCKVLLLEAITTVTNNCFITNPVFWFDVSGVCVCMCVCA